MATYDRNDIPEKVGDFTVPLIMTVYGTRPEAIKMAPIVRALETSAVLEPFVVVTGQHREMLDQVNEAFSIEPRLDLDIFSPGQGIEAVTTRTISGLTPVLRKHRPDALVVQGDTTSAFAAGLAAFYEKIPVVHVEAGLRTATLWSPFPEEGNRRLLTHISSLHLAPTAGSRLNLEAEGVDPTSIVVTGNSVIDALLSTVDDEHPWNEPALESLDGHEGRVVLVTSHRRESWGEPMVRTASAIADLARAEPDVIFVLPLHANPLVQDIFRPRLEGLSNVLLTPALSYRDFARLTARSTIVVTDSGGVQEEAPSLGKPVIVLRESTERPEAVEAGTVKLVGTDRGLIVSEVSLLLNDPAAYAVMANAVNPYGDGHAAARSVAAIEAYFGLGERLPDFKG